MKILYLSVIVIALSLTGCAQWMAVKKGVAALSQQAADEALDVVLWKLCKATSIGSINRWIKGDQDLADAYKIVCGKNEQADILNAE